MKKNVKYVELNIIIAAALLTIQTLKMIANVNEICK